MIHDLQPYPEYKESKQVWLSSVPQHWPVLPNRALFAEVRDREHADEEMLSVTITKGIIRQKTLLSNSSKKDSSRQDKSAYKLVQPRDIAYNKMRAWQGAIGVSDYRGIISPAYVVMRLREHANIPRYFHYLYRTPHFAKEAERWSYGITSDMWSLRPEHFKTIYSPLPPPAEQDAIVRFLDYANGRLDRAIQAKRKMIALLNEQKQAIIHRLVTRGLDPDVSLKHSGIPWLGEVPKHWEVRRAKYLLTEVDSRSTEGTETLLRVSQYTGVTPRMAGDATGMPRARSLVGYKRVQISDLVINIMIAWNGSLGVSGHQGIVSPAYCVYRIGKDQNPWYFHHLLRTRQYGQRIKRGSTGVIDSRLRLYTDALGRIELLVPNSEEQREIVQHVDVATRELSTTIHRIEREIRLLREYQTRLVADIVTGKQDVRPIADRLPTEPIVSEPSLETEESIEPEESDV